MSEVVITSAVRTSIGRLGGGLSSRSSWELGAIVIAEALKQSGVLPKEVSEVILGQVLTAGVGQNPARKAAVMAGIPFEVPAFLINQLCGSGLRAVALGGQAIKLGDSEIVVVGGQECMSQAPHCSLLRKGNKLGDISFVDTLIHDGLWDAFGSCHMGKTAENVAQKWNINRAEQDLFALNSQNKAIAAKNSGRFIEEIVPVSIYNPKGETRVCEDEEIRIDTTLERLGNLKPVFQKDAGSVTAGNSSGISDGAAALLLMSSKSALARGIEPLGRIVSWASTGLRPEIMGMGPVSATRLALNKAGWKMEDLDLIEANEAFASQSCAIARELRWDPEKVNVNGGAIALGHPIGASGARILVTLLHELKRRQGRRGLATLCIGGGMGIALCVERN